MMPREVHEKTEHLFREFNVRIINCCSCKEGLLSVLYRMVGVQIWCLSKSSLRMGKTIPQFNKIRASHDIFKTCLLSKP